MGYETLWITQNVRTTAPPRGGAAPARLEPVHGGAASAGLSELGVAVASGLAARRRCSARPQAGAWGTAQIDRPATRTIAAALVARSPRAWLCQRAVDLEAHR